MNKMGMRAGLVFLFSWVVAAGYVFAGSADMETSDGNHMKVEYDGDNLRIDTGQAGSYMVVNADGMYVINTSGGKVTVLDIGKMMGMFGDMASTAPSVATSKIVSLKAKGQREDYAGMRGEVYTLEYIESGSDQVQTAELVLSDDPRAIKLTKAITGMASAMVTASGRSDQGANDLQERMASLDKGVLRYGNDMWVTTISSRAIAKERFVLPAKPADMSNLAGIVEAINQGGYDVSASTDRAEQPPEQPKQEGPASGYLSKAGKKAEEQADRQQSRVESKAENAVDNAVDSALDKALDKLFGN